MSDILTILGISIPVIIGIFAALCLYFGKIITSAYISKSDKIDYYIHGFLFSALFIITPFLCYAFIRAPYFTNEKTLLVWKEFLGNIVTTSNRILFFIELIPSLPIIIFTITTTQLRNKCLSYHEYYQRRFFYFQ